jgi:hypothetical protein
MLSRSRRYLRRCNSVKDYQEENEPEDGVHGLYGELGCCEQEREERHVASHGQGSEGTKIPAISQCDQAEWYNDKQDCLFVYMPSEEERRIATERDGTDKGLPRRLVQKAKQHGLSAVSYAHTSFQRSLQSECPKSEGSKSEALYRVTRQMTYLQPVPE